MFAGAALFGGRRRRHRAKPRRRRRDGPARDMAAVRRAIASSTASRFEGCGSSSSAARPRPPLRGAGAIAHVLARRPAGRPPPARVRRRGGDRLPPRPPRRLLPVRAEAAPSPRASRSARVDRSDRRAPSPTGPNASWGRRRRLPSRSVVVRGRGTARRRRVCRRGFCWRTRIGSRRGRPRTTPAARSGCAPTSASTSARGVKDESGARRVRPHPRGGRDATRRGRRSRPSSLRAAR